jgi:hypothetical protein
MSVAAMDETAWADYIVSQFAGVETTDDWGYKFFFYGPDRMLPFVTIATSDNEYDRRSQLDRPGVFRLNIGVSRDTFQAMFGAQKFDPNAYDYTVLDQLLPHPDYAAQSFVCVLNPGAATQATVKTLLAEAHAQAVRRLARRQPKE